MQLATLHTPEEMQRISNLAHAVEGLVVGVAALAMMAESRGRVRGSGAAFAWLQLLFVASVLLLDKLIVYREPAGVYAHEGAASRSSRPNP